MKKIGEYTCRGTILEGQEERIILFDGSWETGFKVKSFDIWSSSIGSSGNDCAARLSTDEIGPMPTSGDMMNAADNRQIAWAAVQAGTNGFGPLASIVDPDNMIIQDMYISGQHGGSSQEINYLITMEKYDITDWEGAYAMVRNRSQA